MLINTFSSKTLSKGYSLTKTFWEYFFPFLFSILCSLFVLQLWPLKRLLYPFNYYGDTIFYSMTIKSVVTTGWYLTNPFIGAPGEHFLGDFPTPEGLNYLIIKILTLVTSNWALILNIFFLLGFPLITLSALFVFRQLNLRYPFSFTASLLYAFLPYHLIKEEYHPFLSSYYLAPLAIWIALLLYQNKLFTDQRKKKLLLYFLICVLIGSNGIYYAYFSAFFFLLAGAIGSFREGQWGLMKYASSFILIIFVSLIANLSSTIAYDHKHQVNYEVLKRDSLETEQCGLKIAQLLLPRDHDRLFSKLKDNYNHHALSVTENTSSSLGIIGGMGFLLLIGCLFFKKGQSPHHSLLDALANLNLGALLLATMGGFSSLLSFFFLPGIRAYNRLSIYIAFFSLSAFFLFLQNRVKNPKAIWGMSLLLLLFGLFNQSSPIDAPDIKYPETKTEYKIDRAFVQKIESVLPPNSLIFQLPYIYFPEGPRDKINSYAHFKLPLHTNKFKWSFGAMRNRQTDTWQKETSGLPIPEMIQELKRNGFTGLYVDKFGYQDKGASIMNQLSQIIKTPPLFDHHGRSFWDIRESKDFF